MSVALSREQAVDKIKKVVALGGNNPNRHERTAAMAKAKEMLSKYGIPGAEVGYVEPPPPPPPPRPARRRPAARKVKRGSKLEAIKTLLMRRGGCTTADILAATGWPSVSVPAQAKALGLKLTKKKEGRVTRYRGRKA